MTSIASASAIGRPLPLPAFAAALIALLSFAVSAGGVMFCAVLGALISASYFFNNRLPKGSLLIRSIRLIAMGSLALLRMSESERLGTYAYLDVYVALLGQLSAVELTLQFWQWPPWAGERGAVIICLSGLVFVAAAKTEDAQWIKYFTPLFCLALILLMHAVRERQSRQASLRSAAAVAALCVAFGMGAGASTAIWECRATLNNWATRLLAQSMRENAVGLSSQPYLGSTFNLRLSPRRVLRIEGDLREHHFRGIVFETYNGGIWGPPVKDRDRGRKDSLAASEILSGNGADWLKSGKDSTLQVTRLIDELSVLVAPLNCAGIASHVSLKWIPEEGGPLQPNAPLGGPLAIQVLQSSEPDHQGPLCAPPPPDYRKTCLNVPPGISPRVAELALQIAGAERDPRKRAELIANYLRTHHSYSRTIDPGPGDQISNFLLEKKSAHCEYFASAAVMLLRCANIPARFVSGYYAHDTSPDGVTIVRQFDAHAWAECYIDGRGWITVDATPPEGLPNAKGDEVPWTTAFQEYLEDKWDAFRDWLSELNAIQQVATILILLTFVLFVQWLRAFRSRVKTVAAAPFIYTAPAADLAALAGRFEKLLSARGIPCPPQRTWQEHLAALPAGALNVAEAAEFARRYAQLRFGAADPVAIAELDSRLKALV